MSSDNTFNTKWPSIQEGARDQAGAEGAKKTAPAGSSSEKVANSAASIFSGRVSGGIRPPPPLFNIVPPDMLQRLEEPVVQQEKSSFVQSCVAEATQEHMVPEESRFAEWKKQTKELFRNPSYDTLNGMGVFIEKLRTFEPSFQADGEKQLVDLLKSYAQSFPLSVIYQIATFGITDQEGLCAIAELCARAKPEEMVSLIQNFGLQDEQARVKIALLCAERDGHSTAKYIQHFGITDQNALMRIAKCCISQNSEIDTVQSLLKFNFLEESARVELAKFCAEKAGYNTAMCMKEFRIHDAQSRYEIAKICAHQSGSMCGGIENFDLENKQQRVEIAKICASSYGIGVAEAIKKFHISSLDDRIAIAKLCVRQNVRASQYIQNFEIPEDHQQELQEIAEICILQDPTCWSFFVSLLTDPVRKQELKCFVLLSVPDLGNFVDFQEVTSVVLIDEMDEKFFKNLEAGIDTKNEVVAQSNRQFLQVAKVVFARIANASNTQALQEFVKEILAYRQPRQRYRILKAMYDCCRQGQFSLYQEFVNKFHAQLAPFMSILAHESELLQKACTDFQEVFPQRLSDAGKQLPTIVDALHLLANDKQLSHEDKAYIVQSLVIRSSKNAREKCTELVKRCTMLKLLLENKSYEQLRSTYLSQQGHSLDTACAECIQTIFPFVRSIDNFSVKYSEMLSQFRNPLALFLYKSSLDAILDVSERERCIQAFEKYIYSLFNGTVQDLRYNPSLSPHIKVLSQHAEVLERWRVGNKAELGSFLQSLGLLEAGGKNRFDQWSLVDSDDPCDLLLSGTEVIGSCQAVTGNPNLNKGLLGLLLHGENRILAVKNVAGEIVARRIFRLLYDTTQKHPVLLVEKVYQAGGVDPVVVAALDEYAKERAQAFRLPLLCYNEGYGRYQGGSVEALGGPAPYGYVDSVGGIRENGKFTVFSPKIFS